MAGMLQEAAGMPQGMPPPSSDPVLQTPPQEGSTPAVEGAPGSEQQPATNLPPFEQLQDEAIQLVYGERFDQLVKMFQTNGPDQYARSVAVTVNTTIGELEKKHGGIDPETATKVGMAIYIRILEDTLSGEKPMVEDVQIEQVQETLPAILVMYQSQHPNVSKEDIKNVFMASQQNISENGDIDTSEVDKTMGES